MSSSEQKDSSNLKRSNDNEMRRFVLNRVEDFSGVSGTGIVAEGVELSNGQCVLRWRTKHSSLCIYNSILELELIHGHEGRTKVVWID